MHLARVVLLVVCLVAGAADAAPKLVLNLVVRGGQGEVPAPSMLIVTLGARLLVVEAPQMTTYYAFDSRRIVRIVATDGTDSDDSLFSDIGFREHELRNRLAIAKLLATIGRKEGGGNTTLAEHDLGVVFPGSAPDIDVKRRKGGAEYSANGELMAAYEGPLVPADPATRAGFVNFLRHHGGTHPQVLDALANAEGLPTRIRIVRGITKREFEYTLHAVEEGAEPQLPRTRPAEPDPTDALSVLLAAPLPSMAELLKDRGPLDPAPALEAGHELEAMLTAIERTLTTGDRSDPWLVANAARLGHNPSVARLTQALSPKDKESAQRAAQTLVELRAEAGGHARVLKIFEANTRLGLGDATTAQSLFLEALREAPHIAGAWKDLGDLYYGGYMTPQAWRCWDRGRAIAPGHGLLRDVTELEQHLLREYPEFF